MKKEFIKNVLNLIVSNLLTLVIGFLSSMLTPVILGNTQFGYYKIFTLYMTYVPLLHMGFVDGILIKYSGRKLNNVSLKKFRTYTIFFVIFQAILSFSIFLVPYFSNIVGYYKEIMICISIYSFVLNIVNYFQFFSRAIMKFDDLAITMRLQSYINFIYLFLAFIIFKFKWLNLSASYYLVFIILTQLILLIWYLIKYKALIFGERYPVLVQKLNVWIIFKKGFLIMFSYQIIMLIINADNQFISIFFKVYDYSEYAFAYSLAILLVTVFGSVSSLVLPYMKKIGKNILKHNYDIYLSILCITVFFIIISYYPMIFIVDRYLSSYAESIRYLGIVFPGVGITCLIQSYQFNNFILFNKLKDFCLISIFNLIFDYIVYYVAYILYHDIFILAILTMPLLAIWYIILEIYMCRLINVRIISNIVYLCTMAIAFILISVFLNPLYGCILYVAFYGLFTLCFYKKYFRSIFKVIEKSKSKI